MQFLISYSNYFSEQKAFKKPRQGKTGNVILEENTYNNTTSQKTN